jgi:hypothetical protein
MLENWKARILGEKLEVTLIFFRAIFTRIASGWLERGKPILPEEASQQVTRETLSGYLKLLERSH